ncbi:MAG: tetratricopeptide repeat protein, partial [Acidobacteriota bacterium]
MRKYSWAIIGLALLSWGCVNYSRFYYRLGNEAEINKNWDEAIKHYQKAIEEKPNDYSLQMALTRVRLSASLSHLREARRLAAQGQKEEARVAYEKAVSYDPQNRGLVEELRRLTQPPAKPEPKRERLESPVKLKVGKDKIKLKFPTEVSLRSIFQALSKDTRINILFDEQFKDA